MKKLSFWMSLLIILLLAACTLPTSIRNQPGPPPDLSTATLSPDEVQTQISQMLTAMPTSTGQPAMLSTATQPLPTVPVGVMTATPEAQPSPTQAPEATEVPQAGAPTATPVPPTATPAPAATATQAPAPAFTAPPDDPRNRLGTPHSTDTMDDPDTWIWPTGSDEFTRGTFSNGVQTVVSLDELAGWRMANPLGRRFTDLYLEGTFRTTTCSGLDHYGLIVRVPEVHEPDQGYLFGVSCDGRYSLRRWDGEIQPRGRMERLIDWTSSDAIAKGSNQTNRLGIFTVGNRMILYINGQKVNEVQDPQNMFPSGYFGVFVGYNATWNLTVEVDEMSYWENPQP